jgi:glutamate 5-kinase
MPSTSLRQSILPQARRVVVKVGTQLLTRPDGETPGIDTQYLRALAGQIAALRHQGIEVTLVSSGAIGAGCAALGLNERPRDVAQAQALAAVGQRQLMALMHEAFAEHGLEVGQVLLTRTDFDDRGRFLNIRNCLAQLHALGCVPVLNENDTVAVEEIRFGDNDLLAALICNALRADALVLLTNVDGLLDANGQTVDLVEDIEQSLAHVHSSGSAWGSGGMSSKLDAARRVVEAGELAVIAGGRTEDVLPRLMRGEKLGTVFLPRSRKLDSRQRWIGLTARPAGTLIVDDGAARALSEHGKSLLAKGITDVRGRFAGGAILRVRDARGQEIARGLTNYGAEELRQIQGQRSDQFEALLGRSAYAEVIHRNNLVLLGAPDRHQPTA